MRAEYSSKLGAQAPARTSLSKRTSASGTSGLAQPSARISGLDAITPQPTLPGPGDGIDLAMPALDLRETLLALVAPVGVGELLGPGLRLTGASSELGFRLTVLVDERHEVHVDISPLTADKPHAARTRQLGFAYRSGGAERVDPQLGLRACAAVAAAAARREHAVLTALARSHDAEATRIREVTVTHLL